MKGKLHWIMAIAFIVLFGCASPSHKIPTTPASPDAYGNADCNKMHAEAQLTGNRIGELEHVLDLIYQGDQDAAGVGIIQFWRLAPVLLSLEGKDDSVAAEYSGLKGDMDALEKMAAKKGCDNAMAFISDYREQERNADLVREKKHQKQQLKFH